MKPKQAKKLIWILCAIGIVAMLFSYLYPLCLLVGVVAVGAAVFLDLRFYRCPHCGRFLWRNNGDFCQHCGESIDE